jgi:hypothetical protein
MPCPFVHLYTGAQNFELLVLWLHTLMLQFKLALYSYLVIVQRYCAQVVACERAA